MQSKGQDSDALERLQPSTRTIFNIINYLIFGKPCQPTIEYVMGGGVDFTPSRGFHHPLPYVCRIISVLNPWEGGVNNGIRSWQGTVRVNAI